VLLTHRTHVMSRLTVSCITEWNTVYDIKETKRK